jgi:hypothetical protein
MQKREKASFPSFEWLACALVTSGGCHYIYIGTVCRGIYSLIFVGKTFERVSGRLRSSRQARARIGGVISYCPAVASL